MPLTPTAKAEPTFWQLTVTSLMEHLGSSPEGLSSTEGALRLAHFGPNLLVSAFFHRPWLESFLFAVALAVGLTPELLPMVVSVTLSRGAQRMEANKVIVKRLASILNLGSMDVFCTDKTGTLTEARIHLERHMDPICMLGAVTALTGVVRQESLKKTLQGRIPPAFLELNLKALELGFQLGAAAA